MSPSRTIADLPANPRNPRRISASARAALKKSLLIFGDLSGVVFNRRTRQLVGGHQRQAILAADARIVLIEEFPAPDSLGTVARGYVHAGADRIPYREVDWPESTERAALIAANKHGGEWSRELLSELLRELESDGATDMELTGYFGEALEEAKRQAYDSLSTLRAILDTEESATAAKPVAPRASSLLAVSLTAAEALRWSTAKKRLAERDDKRAFLALLTRFDQQTDA